MTQTSMPLAGHGAPARKPKAIKAIRFFYPIAAAIFIVAAFIGFNRFYLSGTAYPGRPIAPPIKWLVIAHGLSMSVWMLLLMLQSSLILARKHKVHMMLGKIGAGIAAIVIVFGFMLAVQSAAVTPPDVMPWAPLTPMKFMAIPFFSVLIFAIFIIIGIAYRKKPAIHRSMMILGTLYALSAAVARIDLLNNLYLGTILDRLFGPFFFILILGAVMLAVRSAMARSFDKPFAIGLAVLTLASIAIMQIALMPAWESFATMLAS